MRRAPGAFTLIEMLVAISILTVLVLVVAHLFDATTSVTITSSKRIETDAQARPVLDRLAIDIAQMVKRTEVDYYLKSPGSPQRVGDGIPGNDQLAFFAQVSGYYPSTGSQSPISLVAYRINSDPSSQAINKVERLGKGLLWNGVSSSYAPIAFLPLQIATIWPAATNSAPDPQADYEIIGPHVFRFEYYYLLKNGDLSDTPWDTTKGHSSINGMQDLTAIIVALAAIDKKSSVLITEDQLTALAVSMADYRPAMHAGDLLTQWQSAIDQGSVTPPIPRVALSAIRVYERYFVLP